MVGGLKQLASKNPRAKTKKRKHHAGKITPKMMRFVEEYMKDLNGQQAVLRAGYETKHPGQIAKRILDDPEVQKILAGRIKQRTAANSITVDRVLKEFEALAFMPEQYAKAISEVSLVEDDDGKKRVKFKLHDKKGSLDSLGKYLKMFVDRVEMSGVDGEPIKTQQVKDDIAKMFSDGDDKA